MGLIIVWTESSINQLEQIFDYYKNKAGIGTARKLTASIVDKTLLLAHNSELGAFEPLLHERKFKYRHLVEGNYKIIYRVTEVNIIISAVFDCRQNPIKMNRIKE